MVLFCCGSQFDSKYRRISFWILLVWLLAPMRCCFNVTHVTLLIIKGVAALLQLSAFTNFHSTNSVGYFMILSFMFVIIFLLFWYSRKLWKELCTELCHVMCAIWIIITAPMIVFIDHLSNFTLISSNAQHRYFYLVGGGRSDHSRKLVKTHTSSLKLSK